MNKDTIKLVTQNCGRSDCRIYSNGMSSTLAFMPETFDRDGNLLPRPKATVTETVGCTACGATWPIIHGDDGSQIKRVA